MISASLGVLPFIVYSLSFSSSANASSNFNDWDTPCTDGECFYHSEAGSLKVWGSSSAISDLTSAAGWSILNCSTDHLDQDIRLVCNDPDGCTHLQSGSAVGTLVRLPEDCGASPFALVTDIWEHDNQTVPEHVISTLKLKSDTKGVAATTPVVHGITLSTDFASVDHTILGNVSIAIQSSNLPEVNAETAALFVSSSRRRRGLVPQNFIANAFSSFDKNVSKTLPPINIDQSFPIVNAKISCPGTTPDGQPEEFDASITADAQTKANAQITLGLAAKGTIIPPKLDFAGVFAGFDGDLEASLVIKADAKGTTDIGSITLFETPIAGLDFPGILTLGPSFKILAKATATVDIGVDLTLDMKYTATNAKLFFPPTDGYPGGGDFENGGNPLTLSVTPSVASSGTLAAHLIPRLDLGLSALGGIAKADIFLDFDASAGLTLSLTANETESTTVDTQRRNSPWSSRASPRRGLQRRDGSVTGCVDLDADFAVKAGADADFFSIFDKTTSVTLFEKNFDIFQKCFGTSIPTKRSRRSPPLRRTTYSLEPRDDLSCPTSSSILSQLVSVASQ